LIIASVFGSPAPAQDSTDPLLNAWAPFPEVASCAGNCHYNPAAVPTVPANAFSSRGDFSRQNELREWLRSDKHAIARIRIEPLTPTQRQDEKSRLLANYAFEDPRQVDQWVGASNELSRRICDQIGIDVDTESGYNQFASQCLSCHGGYDAKAQTQVGFGKPAVDQPRQPGISCLVCHQEGGVPAADKIEASPWLVAHSQRNLAWRTESPESKSAAGMRDLVTVSKQADLCNDCHVGNLSKGLFVSHAMYAAGHPPLPNVELQTFVDSMPSHWRSQSETSKAMAEASYDGRQSYFEVNFPGLKLDTEGSPIDDVLWQTRQMVIGAVATERRAMEMVDWAAASDQYWGDYAMYDCGACHHALRIPSLRQERGYAGAPGRPRLHEWAGVLTDLLGQAAATGPSRDKFVSAELGASWFDVSRKEESLVAAISSQPFGQRLEAQRASVQLITALNDLIQNMESEAFASTDFAFEMIGRLSRAGQEQLLDYATARQVLWAITVLVDDLRDQSINDSRLAMALPVIQAEVQRWQTPNQAGGTLVSTGGVGIATKLPAGRDMFIYRENLSDELRRRAAYDPQEFAMSLSRIQLALQAK
jgi:hypothetical protein